jgi:GT2 family glycosyltransferase
MTTLALVTVLYNSDNVLEDFIKCLSTQTYKDYKLYLIDNSPTFERTKILISILKKYGIKKYTHIINDENVGVAKGNNQGIELSQIEGCSYTLLLNNDIEFYQENLLEGILNYAILNSEKLLVPKNLYFDSKKISMAGGKLNPYTCVISNFGEGEDDCGQYNSIKHCNYAPTCFMLIKNSIFKEVGIMDEKYFVYYDDTDFVYRAFLNGFLVCYLPEYEILHKISNSTGGSDSLFSIYYYHRNRIYFIKKFTHDFKYVSSLFYFFITRSKLLFLYNTKQRSALKKAIFDGFRMKA